MAQSVMEALVLGEVLFDIFEDSRCLGGAPFNFAYHLRHLGISTIFVSRIGNDKLGREIVSYSKKTGFPMERIQVDPEKPTGEARVFPNSFGGPRFEILTDRAYDFIEKDSSLSSKETPSLIYFGTLAQRNEVSRKTIIKYLENNKGKSRIFLDLNLRSPFFNYNIVDASLSLCDVLKVNNEELDAIQNLLGLKYYFGINSLMDYLHREYDVYLICVTRGGQGCELYEKGKPTPLRQPAVYVEKFEDSVGAGDAFSAILALGIMKEWSIKTTLERASLFASKICTIKGALPQTPDLYTSLSFF